jgi:hypothetical protein
VSGTAGAVSVTAETASGTAGTCFDIGETGSGRAETLLQRDTG